MPHVDLPQAEFKVVLLGDTFTGKTSLVLRFAEGYYRESARSATVGAFFITKRLTVPSVGLTCKIQIWDTAGQEQFKPLAPMYYSNSAAAILCFDPASPKSLETLKYWLDELHRNVPAGRIVIAMAACKCDLLKTQAVANNPLAISSLQEVEELAAQMGAIFVPTSAKNNENVTELFSQVAERVLQFQKNNKITGNNGGAGAAGTNGGFTLGSSTSPTTATTNPRMLSTTSNGIGLVPRPDSTLTPNQRAKSTSALPPTHPPRPLSPGRYSNRDNYLHRRSHHVNVDGTTTTNGLLQLQPQLSPPGSPSRALLTDPNKMNESPILVTTTSPTNSVQLQQLQQGQQQQPKLTTTSTMCGDADYLNCAVMPPSFGSMEQSHRCTIL